MRVLAIGTVAAVALAVGAAFGLSLIQETVVQAYSTGSARFDQQESVNSYGRLDNPTP